MNEEITVRFGADTGPMDRALRSMSQNAASAGDATHKSFIHASNGGKEFKKLLHELTDQSPLLGTALKAAISPIAAAFGGAVIAAKFLTEHIEKLNKSSDTLERGTADPVFKIADALVEAKKRLAEFDEQFQHWARTHGQQSPAEKLTQNLHEQLSLLEKQVGAAEKLSAKDKERLEHQKLLVTRGLQARALQGLARQHGIDSAATNEAALQNSSVLGRTTAENAQSAIAADTEQIAKLKEQRGQIGEGGFWGDFAHDFIMGPDLGLHPGSAQEERERKKTEINQSIAAAEGRIRRNRATVDREMSARKAAANNLSEAQSRETATKSLFDAQGAALEQTDQAIKTTGGFGAGPASDPFAVYTAGWQSRMNAWNKAHGMSPMFQGLSKDPQDKASNDIKNLNDLFRSIIDPGTGMRVNFEVKDE